MQSIDDFTGWLSYSLDDILQKLQYTIDGILGLIFTPIGWIFKYLIFNPLGYILQAIFGHSLNDIWIGLIGFLLVLGLVYLLTDWPTILVFIGSFGLLYGIWEAFVSFFRFGAKTLLLFGMIYGAYRFLKMVYLLIVAALKKSSNYLRTFFQKE